MRFRAVAESGGRVVVRWAWEFGDGSMPVDGYAEATHAYAAGGDYLVALTVTDDRGVRGTYSEIVHVEVPAFVDPSWRLYLDGTPRVEGSVGNSAEFVLRQVVVRVCFYDAYGVRLDDVDVEIADLACHERARFVAEVTEFAPLVFLATVEIQSFVAECSVNSRPTREGGRPLV
ncbi:MAG: PKD domain-containing protein [Candidatus Bipolaricaulota bacterium]